MVSLLLRLGGCRRALVVAPFSSLPVALLSTCPPPLSLLDTNPADACMLLSRFAHRYIGSVKFAKQGRTGCRDSLSQPALVQGSGLWHLSCGERPADHCANCIAHRPGAGAQQPQHAAEAQQAPDVGQLHTHTCIDCMRMDMSIDVSMVRQGDAACSKSIASALLLLLACSRHAASPYCWKAQLRTQAQTPRT